MAGNGIRPATIWPECSLNPTESSYKIFMTFGLILGQRKKNSQKWTQWPKFLQKNEIQNTIGGRKWHSAGQNLAGRSAQPVRIGM